MLSESLSTMLLLCSCSELVASFYKDLQVSSIYPASLTNSTGGQTLAATNIISTDVSNSTKVEFTLKANATNHNSRLKLKTYTKGIIWFDQVSLIPMDTYKYSVFHCY